MTYFVVDMHDPGVEVRPLRQITGEAEFNEVYFTDVRIPDAERLGDVGEGWRVSLTTLMNERVSIGGSVAAARLGPDRRWRCRPGRSRGHDDPAPRDELMQLWIRAEALRLTNVRASQNRAARARPVPRARSASSAWPSSTRSITAFCVDLHGRRRDALRQLRDDPTGHGDGRSTTRRRRSCGAGPTRSRAAPPRSCATSSASGSSACPATSAPTASSPGARSRAAEPRRSGAHGGGRCGVSLTLAIWRRPSEWPSTRLMLV